MNLKTALPLLLAMAVQSAVAAPQGAYDVSLTWAAGTFTGTIEYDPTSPYQVTSVAGLLSDSAQITAITNVWNVSNAVAVADTPLSFTNWNDPSDPLNYNAAFYLGLADVGGTLTLFNPGSAFGLYDWSNPALFDAQLNNAELLSWSIAPVAAPVPEPAAVTMLLTGLAGCALARRRQAARSGQHTAAS
jgi:hypothetical protein